jgi:threonine/homoserine/homoserine lactone efflux protein
LEVPAITAAAVAGLLAGYGIAMPVGAIAVLLISISATTCLCIGVSAGLGAATIDGGCALIAAAGGTGLARDVQAAAGPLRWAAAAMMALLAVWTTAAAVRRYRSGPATIRAGLTLATPARACAALAGLTVLNPLTAAYWAAVFVAAVFAASASWQTVLAGGGALIGRLVTSHRGMLATALASSLLTGLLALRILSP